jgi:type VI secretion system secreted protein Hcp
MAVNLLLKIEGLPGESVIKGHENEIDIDSWSWGASNPGSMHRATGGGTGKVSVQDLNVMKKLDKASTELLLSCCNGKHFGKVNLYAYKSGENPLNYFMIEMSDVIVSTYSVTGSEGNETISEHISFNFAKVKVEYKTQDAKGKEGKGGNMGWDIAKNTKA